MLVVEPDRRAGDGVKFVVAKRERAHTGHQRVAVRTQAGAVWCMGVLGQHVGSRWQKGADAFGEEVAILDQVRHCRNHLVDLFAMRVAEHQIGRSWHRGD